VETETFAALTASGRSPERGRSQTEECRGAAGRQQGSAFIGAATGSAFQTLLHVFCASRKFITTIGTEVSEVSLGVDFRARQQILARP
jgi:hypothetical protein